MSTYYLHKEANRCSVEEDERSILLAQIQVLMDDLGRAARALDSPAIEPVLRRAVFNRFDQMITQRRGQLETVRENVEQVARGKPLPEFWDALRVNQEMCTRLFRECWAFLEGALARSANLDEGICRIADALLHDLSVRTQVPWTRFTIMAEEELFPDMTEIIRLRFPRFSIWNLPISGHEFGHFVASRLSEQGIFPIQKLIQSNPGAFLNEYFADLFAVYTLGPAYAHTCIRQRFNPKDHTAYDDDIRHPAHAKRVYMILQGLQKMDEDADNPEPHFQGQINRLELAWRKSMVSAEQSADLSADARELLERWLLQLYDLLRQLPPAARYTGWLRAQELASELRPDQDRDVQVRDAHTLSDVLNGAWLSRIRHGHAGVFAQRNIEQRAVQACTMIMRHR